MRNNLLNTSAFAIACILGIGVAHVDAASSIRSFGGMGTYTSASNAASANTDGSTAASDTNVARSASMGRTLSNISSGTTSSSDSSDSSATASTSRLSVGKYLSGGKSISGGAKIISQNVAAGGSTNTTEIQQQIDSLETIVTSLESGKQDSLTAGTGIDITNGVISSDVVANVDAKADITYVVAADALKEDLANKSANMTTDTGSNTKYPTVNAVEDYVDTAVASVTVDTSGLEETANKTDDIETNAASSTTYPSTKGVADYVANEIEVKADTTLVSNALNAKEDVANKTIIITPGGLTNNSLYPSASAVEDYVDTAVAGVTVDTSGLEETANRKETTLTGAETLADTTYPTSGAVATYVNPKIYGAPADGNDYVSVVNNGVQDWKQVVY